MMTDVIFLKWLGQCSKVIQELAMSKIFVRHILLAMSRQKCLQEMWSGPGMEDNEYLAMIFLNSCLVKQGHLMGLQIGNSSKKGGLIV